MQIQITPGDIHNGLPQDCVDCAAARAIRRAFNYRTSIFVNHTATGEAYVEIGDNDSFSVNLPSFVADFIEQYDDNDQPMPAPISFNLSAECFML